MWYQYASVSNKSVLLPELLLLYIQRFKYVKNAWWIFDWVCVVYDILQN